MKKLFLITLLAIFIFSFSACGLFKSGEAFGDKTDQMQDSGEAGSADEDRDNVSAGQDNEGNGSDAADRGNGTDEQDKDDSTADNVKMIEVTLYFPTLDNSALKKEVREIPVENQAILKACIKALSEGPKTAGLRAPIPEGTEVRGISIKNKTAVVDLSKEFLGNSGLDEVTARFSIVNTLAEIEGVDKVRLWVEGAEMIGPSGMPLGDMRPVVLDADGCPVPGEIMTVTLYFSDSQAMYVVGEKRDIEVPKGTPPEEQVIYELIAGPRTDDLWSAIPDGTRLISAGTKNGLCTVDFSKEFVENSPGGTASERMAIYSIVNTLTELEGIQQVQFLIEGEKREIYTHAVFDEPFSRNESIIAKKTD